MTESLTRKRRRVEELAGPQARVRIWVSKRDVVRTLIQCRLCSWSSPSDQLDSGQGSTPSYGLAHWTNHQFIEHGVGSRESVDVARQLIDTVYYDASDLPPELKDVLPTAPSHNYW